MVMEVLAHGVIYWLVLSTITAQDTVVQLIGEGQLLLGKRFEYNNTNVHIFLGKLTSPRLYFCHLTKCYRY